MKRFAVILLVLALAYPFGLAFAQEQRTVSWEEHLKLAQDRARARIAERQVQIQRLEDQIEIWQNQLDGINAELKKIEDAKIEEAKPKKK